MLHSLFCILLISNVLLSFGEAQYAIKRKESVIVVVDPANPIGDECH
jgi:hypothetical protein